MQPEAVSRRAAVAGSALIVAGALAVALLARPDQRISQEPGRTGFVVILVATLLGVWVLETRVARRVLAPRDIFVPTTFVVFLFGISAGMWVICTHLLRESFFSAHFVYLEWMMQVASLSVDNGLWNVWTPYPQGTQELAVALLYVANVLGSLVNSDLWTDYTWFRLGFELVFLVGPSIAMVWLVGKLGLPFGTTTQTIAVLSTALSFGIVYYGAATAFVTDPLPVALMLGALLAVARNRFVLAGLAIGAGAGLKLVPIFALPAVFTLTPLRSSIRVLGASAGVLIGALAPGLIANQPMFMSGFNWQFSRPPWESWYAFTNWMIRAPYDYPQPYFQDAAFTNQYDWVVSGITPLISVLQTPVPPGPLRWENAVSDVAIAAAMLLCLLLPSRSSRSAIRRTLFCLAAFFLFAIGWSPQYQLYLIPLMLLAFENPLVGVGSALLLQLLALLEYPVLLQWAVIYFRSSAWLYWATVLGRDLVLGWLCIVMARSECSRTPRARPPLTFTSRASQRHK